MIEQTVFIGSAILIISGIIAGFFLANIAKEELEEIYPYIKYFSQVILVVVMVFSAWSFYVLHNSTIFFIIFALLISLMFLVKRKIINSSARLLSLGLSIAISAAYSYFFVVGLLAFIYLMITTTMAYQENMRSKRKNAGIKEIFRIIIKEDIVPVICLILPLIVGVWYSG